MVGGVEPVGRGIPCGDVAIWVRDLSLWSTLFTEQVCFGHRYLQILFFRARLIKRETLSDKCSFFTIFLRGPTIRIVPGAR